MSSGGNLGPLYSCLVRAGRRARELFELNKRYLEEWWWQRRAQREREDDFWEGLRDQVSESAFCTFVLSTGRCGTQLLTRILRQSERLVVHHSPEPELAVESVRAYASGGECSEFFAGIVTGARMEMVESAVVTGRHYVETNPKITFLAPHVLDVFSGARFVHLIRHPVDFTRSAVSRGYYQSRRTERRHIHPLGGEARESWGGMSLNQKSAWCWAATNDFIDRFLEELPKERRFKVRSEDLFSDYRAATKIAAFCDGAELNPRRVRRLLSRKLNRSLFGESGQLSRASLLEEILEVPLVEKVARRHGYLP